MYSAKTHERQPDHWNRNVNALEEPTQSACLSCVSLAEWYS